MTRSEGPVDPSRRAFFKQTAAGGVTLLGASAATSMLAGCPSDDTDGVYDLHEQYTMDALADTFIPGLLWNGSAWYWSDPTGNGAVQCDVWNVINNSFYGLNGWIEEAVDDLDDIRNCDYSGWSSFRLESISRRTAMVSDALNGDNGYYEWPLCSASAEYGQYTPIYKGALALTKFAYFGAIRFTQTGNASYKVGWNVIGFPGQTTSSGYAGTHASSNPQQSCSGQCGGSGGTCWCDSLCAGYNDCCADKIYLCGL